MMPRKRHRLGFPVKRDSRAPHDERAVNVSREAFYELQSCDCSSRACSADCDSCIKIDARRCLCSLCGLSAVRALPTVPKLAIVWFNRCFWTLPFLVEPRGNETQVESRSARRKLLSTGCLPATETISPSSREPCPLLASSIVSWRQGIAAWSPREHDGRNFSVAQYSSWTSDLVGIRDFGVSRVRDGSRCSIEFAGMIA